MEIRRLGPDDVELARETFVLMGEVFAEDPWPPLSDRYLTRLLDQKPVWVYAALDEGRPVGGLTAHELPMTRAETTELLLYDLAVHGDWQRRGVGRGLVRQVLDDAAGAGIDDLWVPADDEDTSALEFYRRTGGQGQAVTIFSYTSARR